MAYYSLTKGGVPSFLLGVGSGVLLHKFWPNLVDAPKRLATKAKSSLKITGK